MVSVCRSSWITDQVLFWFLKASGSREGLHMWPYRLPGRKIPIIITHWRNCQKHNGLTWIYSTDSTGSDISRRPLCHWQSILKTNVISSTADSKTDIRFQIWSDSRSESWSNIYQIFSIAHLRPDFQACWHLPTWATLQARMAAGTPAPAVAVPAATPPALQMQLSQISNFTWGKWIWMITRMKRRQQFRQQWTLQSVSKVTFQWNYKGDAPVANVVGWAVKAKLISKVRFQCTMRAHSVQCTVE